MKKEAKLYVTFDMLGDLRRSGPLQWQIKRDRTEDIKDHILDLIVIIRLLGPYLPSNVDTLKMIDYALNHDFEEVITGDITGFEGVTPDEKKRVNDIAMRFLISEYHDIMNFEKASTSYEERDDLEAKIVHMLDKVNSSIPFLKYDFESQVDMDNEDIIESLRKHPEVLRMRSQGLHLGEIFYLYHLRKVNFTDEELVKYGITREEADRITDAIKSFMASVKDQLEHKEEIEEEFPKEAMTYRNINKRLG